MHKCTYEKYLRKFVATAFILRAVALNFSLVKICSVSVKIPCAPFLKPYVSCG